MRYEKWSFGELRRVPVSLAKMPGLEDGERYQQKPVDLRTDDRGKHMADKARARRRMTRASILSLREG